MSLIKNPIIALCIALFSSLGAPAASIAEASGCCGAGKACCYPGSPCCAGHKHS